VVIAVISIGILGYGYYRTKLQDGRVDAIKSKYTALVNETYNIMLATPEDAVLDQQKKGADSYPELKALAALFGAMGMGDGGPAYAALEARLRTFHNIHKTALSQSAAETDCKIMLKNLLSVVF